MRDEIEFRAYAMSVGIGELSLEQPTGANSVVDGMRGAWYAAQKETDTSRDGFEAWAQTVTDQPLWRDGAGYVKTSVDCMWQTWQYVIAPAAEAVPIKFVYESEEPITLQSEDSGMALLVDKGSPEGGGSDIGMWVHIGSYDTERNHTEIKSLVGKRVRVTVEVLE